MKKILIIIFIMCFISKVQAQQNRNYSDFKSFYLGAGFGFDYGGISGIKAEFLPIKELGVFGGLGYNLLNAGWNIGASYKILPTKRVTPDLTLMYGYNAVITGTDSYAKMYEKTSYGITVGGGVDIKIGRRGNKFSSKLFVPFRSSSFKDTHNAMENDPYMNSTTLFPIGISLGFNFAL